MNMLPWRPMMRRASFATVGFTLPQSVQHTMVDGGQLSASWMSQHPPMLWPAKCGRTKVEKKTRDTIDVTDSLYLRDLPRKTMSVLDGRVTCVLTKSEKTSRHTNLQRAEIDEVASLETPRIAKGEQILEDALRQLQVCILSVSCCLQVCI
jgi:hypothetical protein